jgi:hypothetical protein
MIKKVITETFDWKERVHVPSTDTIYAVANSTRNVRTMFLGLCISDKTISTVHEGDYKLNTLDGAKKMGFSK